VSEALALAIIIAMPTDSTATLAFSNLKRNIKAKPLRPAISQTLRAEVTQPRSLDLNSLRKSRTKGRARVAAIDRLAEGTKLEANDTFRQDKVRR
jgi:Skp family chaperone for outer membrane proteins